MLGPRCVSVALALALALKLHIGRVQAAQFPLQPSAPLEQVQQVTSVGHKLHGRFLHITDIHPDPFYNIHSDPDEGACHSGHGSAGYYGAEKTSCDSPYTLVNATFRWIQENLKDSIDFVIWTGDSARHDNDEDHPRHDKQVIGQNEFLMHKMKDVFGKGGSNHINAFEIPVVPTIGNNDILPHNIFAKGPNMWTRKYAQIWHKLVPEEQKHQFEEGGWFFVEVIPNKLAVFSLNTMYFFNRNAAVDGCDDNSEPGYEQMEWLRIQLQFLRERGVKAIMSGHVPPARNDEKANWHETCWQKFTLWMQQYRDVIVGSIWGHMNIEHFLLHDFHDIERSVAKGHPPILADEYESGTINETGDEPFHIADKADYLESLRHQWSKLPDRPSEESSGSDVEEVFSKKKSKRRKGKKKASKTREHYHKEIGGEWAERYAVSFISPSVIPNFFPSLRVFEYNITGLEDVAAKQSKEKRCDFNESLKTHGPDTTIDGSENLEADDLDLDLDSLNLESSSLSALKKHRKIQISKKSKKHKKKHKRKRAKFTVPDGPSPTGPPGPAYSPQTLSWLGYTQYYANLTRINNETSGESGVAKSTHKGGKRRSPIAYPTEFEFEVEYDSRAEKDVYDLSEGIFVRDLVDLAARIGDYKPNKRDKFVEHNDNEEEDEDVDESESGIVHALQNSTNISISDEANSQESKFEEEEREEGDDDDDDETQTDLDAQKHKKHKKHKKKKKKRKHRGKRQRIINKTWFTFVDRALVGTASAEDLHRDFGDEDVGE